MITDNAIRVRSYLIWEREGRPQGRSAEHWILAEAELADKSIKSRATKAKSAAPTRKRSVARTN